MLRLHKSQAFTAFPAGLPTTAVGGILTTWGVHRQPSKKYAYLLLEKQIKRLRDIV